MDTYPLSVSLRILSRFCHHCFGSKCFSETNDDRQILLIPLLTLFCCVLCQLSPNFVAIPAYIIGSLKIGTCRLLGKPR